MSKSHLSMLIRSSSLHLSKLHQHLICQSEKHTVVILNPKLFFFPHVTHHRSIHCPPSPPHHLNSKPNIHFCLSPIKAMSDPIICLKPVYIPVASPCSQNLKQNLGLQDPALCAPTNLSSLISSHSSCTLGSSYNGLSVPHVPLPKLVVSPSG